jgi:predicted dehydrogenase
MDEMFAVIGCGSIGKRHAANLAAMQPKARIYTVDPFRRDGVDYSTVEALLLEHPFLNGALLCSPHDTHLDALDKLTAAGTPVYLEKPVCGVGQWRNPKARARVEQIAVRRSRVALGFQYRYHAVADRLFPLRGEIKRMDFIAHDNLAERYGPTVLETMASHSIDLALWLLGEPASVRLRTNGLRLNGSVLHAGGAESHYLIEMDAGPRESQVVVRFARGNAVRLTIDPDPWMYQRCLGDWLNWALDDNKMARLAALRDGMNVQAVLGAARWIKVKEEA